MEEALVLAALRSGDRDAFAEIVEQYQAPVIRYVFRLTGDHELARDLAQDTFVQAYKAILKTDSDLRLKAWLYRIATNNVLQNRRRGRLLSFVPFEEWRRSQSGTGDPDDPSDTVVVQLALSRVPADHRICLVLHFVEGFKYAEIAETLGISQEAVRKRVARGKQAFRRAFSGGEEA